MSRSSLSNPLALAVMATLWEEPMHPYRITTTLRERGKEQSIRLNWGSLYSVIASLEKNGLIEATRSERTGARPERTIYALTEAGRAKTIGWLRHLIGSPAKEYPDFEAGLSLVMLLSPDEALGLLRTRLAGLDERIGGMESDAAYPLPEVFLVESHYALAMARAERAYVADLVDRLAGGAVGGQHLWTQMHQRLAAGETLSDLIADLTDQLTDHPREEGPPNPEPQP